MSNTFYNFSNINFNLKTLSSIFFNKDTKMSVLDPLTCIIRCAILSNKPYGTKISIIDNRITFHDPTVLQGTIRWTQGDKREDLHNIYNPLLKATQWYKRENKDILNIFILAKKGLDKLKKSYDESSIISHSLAFYINILEMFIEDKQLDSYLSDKQGENKNKVYGMNNQKKEEDNKIYKGLRELWDDTQISIINNILIQVDKEPKNSSEWLKSLDIILSSKEKQVSEIITKNTTQLS